jgi:Coenzyme PQQ synthesis protein D (PqqD)
MSDPKLARHEQTSTHPSGQRVVVFHSETKDSIVLNPTGSWLWNQLEQPRRQSELVASLCQEHPDVPDENIAKDVEFYVKELVENKILVASD